MYVVIIKQTIASVTITIQFITRITRTCVTTISVSTCMITSTIASITFIYIYTIINTLHLV